MHKGAKDMNNTKWLSRRRMLKASSAALSALGLIATTGFGKSAFAHANKEEIMDIQLTTPSGPGSVSGAPELPKGFSKTFTSRFIRAGGLRQHAVIGGDGPPLLLVHGWPETWYAWRLLMPALARDFDVIAVDQRGPGRPRSPRRDPRAPGGASLTAPVRPRADQRPALAPPLQPDRQGERTAHRGTGGRLLPPGE